MAEYNSAIPGCNSAIPGRSIVYSGKPIPALSFYTPNSTHNRRWADSLKESLLNGLEAFTGARDGRTAIA
jgi:hypothetical protein